MRRELRLLRTRGRVRACAPTAGPGVERLLKAPSSPSTKLNTANDGLGEGDVAGLPGNPLSSASIRRHVPALREQGVSVLAGLCAVLNDGDNATSAAVTIGTQRPETE